MTHSELTADEMERLTTAALSARLGAYAPYSRFLVGAAILTESRTIFQGANVENASYGLTICAERTAVCTAVVAGARTWRAIAIASRGGVTPCGACRQFLAEFAPRLEVLLIDAESQKLTLRTDLSKLLPYAFDFQESSESKFK